MTAESSEVKKLKKTPGQLLTERVVYLKGLKAISDQQALLVLLHDKPTRTDAENKKLVVLWRAEVAGMRASAARLKASNMLNAEDRAAKVKERKARDHELYQAAGLLILSGLVDSKMGIPVIDRGELLGALLGLSKVPHDDTRRAEWKRAGDALMAGGKNS